jgi:hypothetical protein
MYVCVCVCVHAHAHAHAHTHMHAFVGRMVESMCLHASVCVGVGARALVSACMHVALQIQHPTRCHIAIYSLPGSSTFFNIIS